MDSYYMAATHSLRSDRGSRRSRDQRPLRLLSLDGGGVRGFSTLLLIQELMLHLFVELEGRAPRPEEIPKPCDHFDLIGGVGTGGLIAILLGRLRMDLETCKDVYVKVSKKVFQSDKTIAGLPLKKTLFKASLLEEAIREIVNEYECPAPTGDIFSHYSSPRAPGTPASSHRGSQKFQSAWDASSTEGSVRSSAKEPDNGGGNALLFDPRPDRCKTLLMATFKGSDEHTPPAFLRTYESAQSTAISPKCTIWQAGRATAAHFPAFKHIKIGHDIFIDDGSGRYSPVVQILEEAMVHEWPGREVGVLVSIGSGKVAASPTDAPSLRREQSSSFLRATSLGKMVDAKHKHMAKMKDCEKIHQELVRDLERKGVAQNSYFRFNVEVGMGDFGINEWSRMAEISVSTRKYLSKPEVHATNRVCAEKMANIHLQPLYGRSSCSTSQTNSTPSRSSKGSYRNYVSRELPLLPHIITQDCCISEDDEIQSHIEGLEALVSKIHANHI